MAHPLAFDRWHRVCWKTQVSECNGVNNTAIANVSTTSNSRIIVWYNLNQISHQTIYLTWTRYPTRRYISLERDIPPDDISHLNEISYQTVYLTWTRYPTRRYISLERDIPPDGISHLNEISHQTIYLTWTRYPTRRYISLERDIPPDGVSHLNEISHQTIYLTWTRYPTRRCISLERDISPDNALHRFQIKREEYRIHTSSKTPTRWNHDCILVYSICNMPDSERGEKGAILDV